MVTGNLQFGQSPILLGEEAFENSTTPLNIKIQWSSLATGKLNPPDPTRSAAGDLKVSFDPGNNNIVTHNGATFELAQFHFHSPGEHVMYGGTPTGAIAYTKVPWLSGDKKSPAPIELHMVFGQLNSPSASMALTLVLAVMIYPDEGAADSDDQARCVARAADGQSIELRPAFWLPGDPEFVLRYLGSLTTDPYTERVIWVIIGHGLSLSPAAFDELNARPMGTPRDVQPLNGRVVSIYPWPIGAITTT